MGTSESILDLKKHRGAHGLVNCHVFAKREHIARLEGAQLAGRTSSLTLHAVAGHEHLEAELVVGVGQELRMGVHRRQGLTCERRRQAAEWVDS